MKRRLGTPLTGIGFAFVMMAFLGAAESGFIAAVALAFVVMGLVWLVARAWRNRRPVAAGSWVGPTAATRFTPSGAHEPSSKRGVVRALSTVEAREIVVSASFGVGLGFCLLMLILFGIVWGPDWGGNLPRSIELYPIYAHPLVGMIVIASHRARTRSRRDGAEELFESCPTDQATRTASHLATAWVPAVALVVFLVTMTLLSLRSFPVAYGGFGERQVVTYLGVALLGVGGTALGVALARWTPWILAPVAVLIALAFGTARLSSWGGSTEFSNPVRQLSTWLGEPPVDLRFTAPNWVAHHTWILALVLLTGLVAMVRDLRSPRLALAGIATTGFAIASALVATQPMDVSDAERIAALINDPAAHQECLDPDGLLICVYEGDTALAQHLADELAPVVAASPDGALDGRAVRYGTTVKLRHLDPAVLERLRPEPRSEKLIPLEFQAHRAADEGARFWTALAATGIAGSTSPNLRGTARGVVALWLATRGADADTAAAMTSAYPGADPGDPKRFRPWPDACMAGNPPVHWALSDLEAARLVMALPEATVRGVLHADWDRFTQVETTTDELLDALGLDPLGPPRGTTRSTITC